MSQTYTLSTGDRLRITLLQNQQVNDSYLIEIDGTISVPGIGVINASGLDVRTFEDRLREMASITIVDPSVSVQIVGYRPFYVLGDVQDAGSYPFTPNLDVMKAVAIAGGFGRRVDSNVISRTIAVNQTRKSLAESQIDLFSSKVNLARLIAERDEADDFVYIADLADATANTGRDDVIISAQALFMTRQEAFITRLTKLQGTLDARTKEIASYQSQIELQNEVLETSKAELQKMQDAKDRGLVTEARINQVIRDEQNMRAQALQIITLKRQSEVSFASVERDIADLIANRNLDLDGSIQVLQDDVKRMTARVREDKIMLREIGSSQIDPETGEQTYRLELYRDGLKLDQEVSYGSALSPGDTLFVIINADDLKSN